mgnify:CR=1 FL=1
MWSVLGLPKKQKQKSHFYVPRSTNNQNESDPKIPEKTVSSAAGRLTDARSQAILRHISLGDGQQIAIADKCAEIIRSSEMSG